MIVSARGLDFKELNRQVRDSADSEVVINDCYGQRFIASGLKGRRITINGTPGNALGAYLDGSDIIVNGNAQDAVGDTMNGGKIVVHGNAGDALGYAMRGGQIFVKGSSGYRTGIHMKEYKDKKPVIVVGGGTGSFLGEYLAGGLIIVLGLDIEGFPAGNFPGTGMHGGEIFIRTDTMPTNLPKQVSINLASQAEMDRIGDHLREYSDLFGVPMDVIIGKQFYHLTPNAKNPYKRLYTEN
jgi:glutamate synthase domain-containing protein 3